MSGSHYKVKLASGRILGPLDLGRVRQLILKNQIVGTEQAREYPQGEWVNINSIAPIADLLIARADGRLAKEEGDHPASGYSPLRGDPAATQVLPGADPSADLDLPLVELEELKTQSGLLPEADPPTAVEDVDRTKPVQAVEMESQDDDKTTVAPISEDDERTKISDGGPMRTGSGNIEFGTGASGAKSVSMDLDSALDKAKQDNHDLILRGDQSFAVTTSNQTRIAQEKTVVFQRSPDDTGGAGGAAKRAKKKIVEILKSVAIAVALGMAGYEAFLADTDQPKDVAKWEAIRPKLPAYIQGDPKPEESNKLYALAMKDYVLDNVVGYKLAADKLLRACAHDSGNVKALAMLASSYLNLIDSSNKDENYFAVISKLIDMSRAGHVDLPETVIAEVEFFITANKAEAAESRVVEYTKNHPTFGPEMYYYLGLAFYHRGDLQNAARYLGGIPDNKAFSPKVFYLRGRVAEKLNDPDSAFSQYDKAVRMSASHARSRLRIAGLYNKKGALKEAAGHLDYLVTHTGLLAPKELAEAYFLHSQLSQLYKKPDVALGDMERAVKLDRDNHDYQLELYTLRAKAGDTSIQSVRKDARMYFFLSEGEKVLRDGKTHEALVEFLQANEANPVSPLPLVKIGDMFRLQNDLGNAMANYKKASEKAPNNIEVWSKYIGVLIQSFEWDEAKKAMDKFRNLPVPQSAIDKAAADMYEKQGQHAEAQMYYKKAMARDTVDPDVYIAFAKSLMATKNYKEAPFFFALALRFDPLNGEALLGTAKCIAATDSIDRAVSMLQDELSKSSRPNAAILSAIAEFDIQKGDWDLAQQNVDQARAADPDYAYAWKLQAQIYMNKEGTDKDALDKAAAAYQSYSERNPSDPSGYLERYNIYLRKTNFEKASEELNKIFALFPKYPKLHFYKGWLYSAQGNHKASAEEYKKELDNNPQQMLAIIGLGKEKIEMANQTGGAESQALIHGAQELFNKAMQISPTNAEAKQQAGYAAYLLKNYQAAIALYNAALVYDKANPLIFKRLAVAYRDMGDDINACQSFHKYVEMEPDAPDKHEFERCR
jgi:tetratricopeptide (TPR) repeat protein